MKAPASFMQRRLFLAAIDGVSYDAVPVTWRLTGELDLSRLQDAFRQVVARHDSLRTTLERNGSEIVQRISRDRELVLDVVDLVDRPSGRSRALRRLLAHRVQAPFDLHTGEPLARATLLRIGRQQHVLAVTLHHAIADGWSEYVLMRDLLQAYDGRDLAVRPVMQMAEYAAWETSSWFDGRPPRTVPASDWPEGAPRYPYMRSGGPPDSFELIVHRGPDFAPAVVRRFAQMAGREHATVTMGLTAAAAMTLAPYVSGSVNVGLLDANRRAPELRDVIGCIFDVIPLVVNLPPNARGVDVIAAIRDQVLNAYDSPGPLGAATSQDRARIDVSMNVMPAAVGKSMADELSTRRCDPCVSRIAMPMERTRRVGRYYYVGSSVEFVVGGLPNGTLQTHLVGNGRLIAPSTLAVLTESFGGIIRRLAVGTTVTTEG